MSHLVYLQSLLNKLGGLNWDGWVMLLPTFRKFQRLFCFCFRCFTAVLKSVRVELLDVWGDEEEEKRELGEGRKGKGGGQRKGE